MKKLCIYLLFKLGKKTLSRVERTLFMKNRDLSLPCPFNLYGFHIEDNEDPNFPFRVYFFAGEKALGTRIAHWFSRIADAVWSTVFPLKVIVRVYRV
jgi:hypothetical protein